MSALSQLFKDVSSSEEGNSSTDEEDQVRADSAIEPVIVSGGIISQPTERTALLLKKQAYGSDNTTDDSANDLEGQKTRHVTTVDQRIGNLFTIAVRHSQSAATRLLHPKSWDSKAIWKQTLFKPAGYVPPVILGLLLNILDALSYGQYDGGLHIVPLIEPLGMILFPLGQPVFASLGVDGISMFYVSCIVSQLVYSLGGSIFKGGIGSEMVEALLHRVCNVCSLVTD